MELPYEDELLELEPEPVPELELDPEPEPEPELELEPCFGAIVAMLDFMVIGLRKGSSNDKEERRGARYDEDSRLRERGGGWKAGCTYTRVACSTS